MESYRLRNLVHVSTVEPVQTHEDMRIPAKNGESRCNCILAALGRISILHSDISKYFVVMAHLRIKKNFKNALDIIAHRSLFEYWVTYII